MKVHQSWGIAADGSAFSHESYFVPGARLPDDPEPLLRALDRHYYRWIPNFTGDLVQIVKHDGGGQSAKVVFGPTGLTLGPARIVGAVESGWRIERPILGGWLVGAESGALGQELLARDGGVEAAVDLRAFRPRMLSVPFGRALYDFTQEAIHRRLSRAYLRHDVAPLLLSLACSSSTLTRT